MDLIQFEAGTKVSDAKVTINGVDYPVTPARYTGNTPLSVYVLNLMQSNIAKAVVPTGGTAGQVLVKKSNADNDVEWQTGGGGGASGDTFPIGAISEYAGATAPTNWLICDGSAISRTTYADLFNVIGTRYGTGDGSTTFNLPDLRGRIPVGLDSNDTDFDTLGETGGEKTHTLTTNELPSNMGTFRVLAWKGDYPSGMFSFTGLGSYDRTASGGTDFGGVTIKLGGQGQPHNIMQPYIVQNYIIKAFQSSGVVANVAQVETDSQDDVYSCNYINEYAIGEVIYNNINGANNNISLTKAVSNFTRLKIYYASSLGDYYLRDSKEFIVSDGCSVPLTMNFAHSDSLQIIDMARYLISGSTITKTHETSTRLGSGGYEFEGSTSRILISKVIGYK